MHQHAHSNEEKTKWVVLLTAVTMVVEIGFGYWTNSMALLADGFHMASHVLALGLSWAAYYFSRKYAHSEKYGFSREKALALSGFASAIVLLLMAVIMLVESVQRIMHPQEIRFTEAIVVTSIGLIVNAVSALFLHHDKKDSDHNIRSAYLHVLADMITSIGAITALVLAKIYSIYWLDSLSGIICSVVITKWAVELIFNSGKDLIEFQRKDKQSG